MAGSLGILPKPCRLVPFELAAVVKTAGSHPAAIHTARDEALLQIAVPSVFHHLCCVPSIAEKSLLKAVCSGLHTQVRDKPTQDRDKGIPKL